MNGQSKEAVDARLKRLLRGVASGRKAGGGTFLTVLRRAKKKGRQKTAAGGSFIREKVREESFSPGILPPKPSLEARRRGIDWDSVLGKVASQSPVFSCLAKIASDKGENRVVLTSAQSKIEGSNSQVDQATSKLAEHHLREKIASEMLQLDSEVRGHRKRAHALKLLYKQAELGVTQLPQTFSDLEEKLAAMQREDLTVLERALELTGGNVKLGELCGRDGAGLNASEKFQASILGDDA